MLELIGSGVLALIFCVLITVVLAIGWRYLQNERDHLAALNSYIVMRCRLGHQIELKSIAKEVVDDIVRIENASDPARQQNELDSMWKRAARLEGSVDFWVDLLQKLGLLGTVLGLGLALALEQQQVTDLLEPLSMAVWTTVLGLIGSIAISWKFGRDVDVEVDAHEENLREWQAVLRHSADSRKGPAGGGPGPSGGAGAGPTSAGTGA